MNPDNFNMSEQELNAQRRRRAENFKLNIDESEYEDDNFVKSEDEPSNLNSYSGQDVKKQMARESKQVLKQKKKEEKKALKAKNKYNRRTFLDYLGFNCRSNGGCIYDNRHERFACREQDRLLNREN